MSDYPRNLSEALLVIYNGPGIEYLLSGEKLLGTFSDVAPFLTAERNQLEIFIKVSGPKKLMEASLKNDLDPTVKKLVRELSESYGMDLGKAEELCRTFAAALRGEAPSDAKPEPEAKPQDEPEAEPEKPKAPPAKEELKKKEPAPLPQKEKSVQGLPRPIILGCAAALVCLVIACMYFVNQNRLGNFNSDRVDFSYQQKTATLISSDRTADTGSRASIASALNIIEDCRLTEENFDINNYITISDKTEYTFAAELDFSGADIGSDDLRMCRLELYDMNDSCIFSYSYGHDGYFCLNEDVPQSDAAHVDELGLVRVTLSPGTYRVRLFPLDHEHIPLPCTADILIGKCLKHSFDGTSVGNDIIYAGQNHHYVFAAPMKGRYTFSINTMSAADINTYLGSYLLNGAEDKTRMTVELRKGETLEFLAGADHPCHYNIFVSYSK
ncbi:MAG: hypothetical protein II376_00305 [Clostridia bacterium]|nr:hypothetical protein [Clostridia bacterium]